MHFQKRLSYTHKKRNTHAQASWRRRPAPHDLQLGSGDPPLSERCALVGQEMSPSHPSLSSCAIENIHHTHTHLPTHIRKYSHTLTHSLTHMHKHTHTHYAEQTGSLRRLAGCCCSCEWRLYNQHSPSPLSFSPSLLFSPLYPTPPVPLLPILPSTLSLSLSLCLILFALISSLRNQHGVAVGRVCLSLSYPVSNSM